MFTPESSWMCAAVVCMQFIENISDRTLEVIVPIIIVVFGPSKRALMKFKIFMRTSKLIAFLGRWLRC